MDLNSLDKTLNSILNTLPCTVAPLEAISYSVKKSSKYLTFTSRLSPFNDFFSNYMNLSEPCLKESRKQKVNENPEN